MSVRGQTPSELYAQVRFDPPVPTGIPNLDEVLGGGLRVGSVAALVGPPTGSKTGLLLQMGLNRARAGAFVAFHFADEDGSMIYPRLCALASGWPSDALLNLNRQNMDVADAALNRLKLRFFERRHTFEEVREAVVAECPPDIQAVLLLDSAQKIKPTHDPLTEKHTQVNALLEAVTDATRRHGWVTILASKASRDSYSGFRQPVGPLATGAESSYLESDADTVIALSGDIDKEIKVSVPKNRNGGRGECFLVLDRTCSQIRPVLEAERTVRQAAVTTERAARRQARDSRNAANRAAREAEKERRRRERIEAKLRKTMQDEVKVVEAIQRSPGATSAALSRLAGLGVDRFRTVATGLGERVRADDRGRGRGCLWFPADSEAS
jgi:RecA/RadA recombinase